MIRKFYLLSLLAFTTLGINAQPKAKYEKTEYQLGNIAWHEQATASIKITNSGNKPLQIIEVEPGCECTLVSWNKDAIAPGSSTTITVTYNAQTLGTFRREVAVRTDSAEEPTYLVLTGTVTVKGLASQTPLPYKLDNVSISTELIEFDDVVLGENPSVSVTITNNGKKEYTPEFINMPNWLTFKSYPEVILPGNSGRVTFTLNSSDLPEMGLTQTNIYIARYHGDKKRSSNEISVCATLVPRVALPSTDNPEAVAPIPVAVIPNKIGLGKKLGKKRVSGSLHLKNQGNVPLHVSAIQVYNPSMTVVLSNTVIEPGEQAVLKVTANSNVLQQKQPARILIMCDDPVRPKLSIDLTTDEPEK